MMRRIATVRMKSRKKRQKKLWKPIFFTRRPFEDLSFFEAREIIADFERDGGPLDAFLQDTESSIPSWETSVVKQFLLTRQPHPTSSSIARARLDDREYSSGRCRESPEWLIASELRQALEIQVGDFRYNLLLCS
jgi:hypothetical protein